MGLLNAMKELLGVPIPTDDDPNPESKPWYKTRWGIALIVVGVLFAIGIATSPKGEAPLTSVEEKEVQSTVDYSIKVRDQAEEIEALKAERDAAIAREAETSSTLARIQSELDAKLAAEAEAQAAKAKTNFSEGVYLVGTDMPPGRYKGTPSGGSAYWQISSDANGENIIANGNEAGNFYAQVSAGQYLSIRGAEMSLVQ